ncbi:MAG: hypothetical protein MI674_04885 [Cytophagales bacterium]|nr:hypothetical protein [Cytophagales bacterium]
MSTLKTKQSQAIPGFKVMEWLERIREEDYKLSKENPQEYAKKKERIRKQFERKRMRYSS